MADNKNYKVAARPSGPRPPQTPRPSLDRPKPAPLEKVEKGGARGDERIRK